YYIIFDKVLQDFELPPFFLITLNYETCVFVIPAKAGIQSCYDLETKKLDSRLRGNDRRRSLQFKVIKKRA
ncbi:MAG: hypothetical protein WCG60_02845, partial [bacterium]